MILEMMTGRHHKKEMKMSDWLLFTIGVFVGSTLGIIVMALLSINRVNEMEAKMKKLESGKPTPRKFRHQLPHHLRG